MPDFDRSYVLPFERQRVYEAWVSSETVIAPAARMRVEPKPGGAYQLEMPDGSRMCGTFTEVEPGVRVAYSWQWDGSDEATTVEVSFDDHADGCSVRVRHRGFQSQESFDNHSRGWDSYVEGFIAHLSGQA